MLWWLPSRFVCMCAKVGTGKWLWCGWDCDVQDLEAHFIYMWGTFKRKVQFFSTIFQISLIAICLFNTPLKWHKWSCKCFCWEQWKTIKVVLQRASCKQQKISVVLVVNTSCQTGGLCKKSLWSPAACWSLELIGKLPWNERKEEAESGLSWGTNWRGSGMSKTKACNNCLRPSYRLYEPISQAPKVTTFEQPNLDAFWSSIDTTLGLIVL